MTSLSTNIFYSDPSLHLFSQLNTPQMNFPFLKEKKKYIYIYILINNYTVSLVWHDSGSLSTGWKSQSYLRQKEGGRCYQSLLLSY